MAKSSKNLILTGFMGSGKSETGKLLAERLNIPFYDMDEMIATDEGMSVSDIFAKKGEAYFRKLETSFIESIKIKSPFILSTGGGVVVRKENRKIIKALGVVVYLKTSPESVFERLVGDDSRPLLQVPDAREKIKTMMHERASAYSDCDIVQETDSLSVEEVVERVICKIM